MMPTSTLDTSRVDKGPSITPTLDPFKASKLRKLFFNGLALGTLGFIGAPVWAFYKGFTITYNHLADKSTASNPNNKKISWHALAAAIPAGLFSLIVNTPSSLFLAPFEAGKLGANEGFINGLKIIFEPLKYVRTFILKQEVHNPFVNFVEISDQWWNEINDLSQEIVDITKLPKAIKKVPKLIQTYERIQEMYDELVALKWFEKMGLRDYEIIQSELKDIKSKLKILKNILVLCDTVSLLEKKVSTHLTRNSNVGSAILDMKRIKNDIKKALKVAYQSKKDLTENNEKDNVKVKNLLNLLVAKIENLKVLLFRFSDAYGIDTNIILKELNFFQEENEKTQTQQNAPQVKVGEPQPALRISKVIIAEELNTNHFKQYKKEITPKTVAKTHTTSISNMDTNSSMDLKAGVTGDKVEAYIFFPPTASSQNSSKEEINEENLNQPTKPTTQPPPMQQKGIFQSFVNSVHNFFSRGKKTTVQAENLSKGSNYIPQQKSQATLTHSN